ncbi:Sec-independent protein translocase subunit TatA [Nesterenkonia suensis]
MNITGWQIAIIALLIILLFGAPKLPQLAKSVGQSMRIFKSEVRTMSEESQSTDSQDQESETGSDERPAVEGRVMGASENPRRSGSKQRRDHA